MPEVILSVFILSIGLVTIVSVMTGSLRHSLGTRDAIIAAELAQEGIELARNVRDNDFADGGNGFPGTSFQTNQPYCRIDWNDTRLRCRDSAWSPGSVRYDLQYSGGLYAHAVGGGVAKFARYIYVNYDDTVGQENAIVRTFVTWTGFTPPDDGSPTGCTIASACVFTETFLTAWKN